MHQLLIAFKKLIAPGFVSQWEEKYVLRTAHRNFGTSARSRIYCKKILKRRTQRLPFCNSNIFIVTFHKTHAQSLHYSPRPSSASKSNGLPSPSQWRLEIHVNYLMNLLAFIATVSQYFLASDGFSRLSERQLSTAKIHSRFAKLWCIWLDSFQILSSWDPVQKSPL